MYSEKFQESLALVEAAELLELSREDINKIFYENAVKLYK